MGINLSLAFFKKAKLRDYIIVLNFFNVLDYVTTYVGINYKGFQEMNPVIEALIQEGMWIQMFIIKFMLVYLLGQWIISRNISLNWKKSILGMAILLSMMVANSNLMNIVVHDIVFDNILQIF